MPVLTLFFFLVLISAAQTEQEQQAQDNGHFDVVSVAVQKQEQQDEQQKDIAGINLVQFQALQKTGQPRGFPVRTARRPGWSGRRLVGGMRASIYNAMPVEGVKKLVDFMREFEKNA